MPLYLRALRPWRGQAAPATRVPDLSATAAPFVPGRARLQRFCELVGHRNPAFLPLTYPQVLAAPLQLALLTSSQIPFNPAGLVHVGNRIVVRRPIPATEPVALAVSVSDRGESPRGREFALDTVAHDPAGEQVWQASATLLARSAAPRPGRPARESRRSMQELREVETFVVPARTGRRYARVSDDYNPIHLSALTARPFGFRRPIAHGMWSLARVLGVLGDTAAPQQAEVRFHRPLLMPAQVTLYASRGRAAVFALRDRKSRKNYLIGELSEPT